MFRLCQLVFWLLLPVGASATCFCSASGATEDQALNSYYSTCQTEHKECLSIEDSFVCSNISQSEELVQKSESSCGVTVQQQFSGALIESSTVSSVTSSSSVNPRDRKETVFRRAESSSTVEGSSFASESLNYTADSSENTPVREIKESKDSFVGVSSSRGQFSACCFRFRSRRSGSRKMCLVLKGEHRLTQPGMVCRPL